MQAGWEHTPVPRRETGHRAAGKQNKLNLSRRIPKWERYLQVNSRGARLQVHFSETTPPYVCWWVNCPQGTCQQSPRGRAETAGVSLCVSLLTEQWKHGSQR